MAKKLVDVIRWHSKRWYVTAQYRNKELRRDFSPKYGVDAYIHVVSGKPRHVLNIFIHRFVLFFEAGQRFSNDAKPVT